MTSDCSYFQVFTGTLETPFRTIKDTFAKTCDAKTLFMECNETIMVNGGKMLQLLKVQSWVYLHTFYFAFLLSSSTSGLDIIKTMAYPSQ